MKSQLLPVYSQKDRILSVLEKNSVIVVESPTGSGKTTQLPIILHEAGYSENGMIGVTQPRRIAALSVSEYIAKELNCERPHIVGYKMRFADLTSDATKIKIMTDGTLLQELKLDPYLSKYSIIMVDEAHERSLNIDFILGLLKRIIQERRDFKVIISSATINTKLFSTYFAGAPIIKIESSTYPITLIFDPPSLKTSTENPSAEELLYDKIASIIERVIQERRRGGVLVFLPGERSIKNCILRLSQERWYRKLWIVPLYGRLSKEEQDRVFLSPPFTKRKVVIATNIAETSITINDINTVIDSGLAKLNFYNPFTYTSSLDEAPVSKSSCNQRRGRAGRTEAGVCYRLYSRDDFEERPLYTMEEIYRTDLSEVVLRMSELGIYNFEHFDFISPTSKKGIIGAIDTLNMLHALEEDRSLSNIGKIMCKFPLPPRQSRMIAEAILNYPNVLEEVIIAASFLSVRTPFSFPDGYEALAREAHNIFYDKLGDFVSFLKAYSLFIKKEDREAFCKKTFLDIKIMEEICSIKEQLALIVSDMGIPILSGGGIEDYLTCIARGMIQGVCVRYKRGIYRSLTTEKIVIHPGSSMYREESEYIVAGEIVRTSRMYAMSVSALSKSIIKKIAPTLLNYQEKKEANKKDEKRKIKGSKEKKCSSITKDSVKAPTKDAIKLFDVLYHIEKTKKKELAVLDFYSLKESIEGKDIKYIEHNLKLSLRAKKKVLGCLKIDKYRALEGEKIKSIVYLLHNMDISPLSEKEESFLCIDKPFTLPFDSNALIKNLSYVMRLAPIKEKGGYLGLVMLYFEKNVGFSFKLSKTLGTALQKTIFSLQIISEVFRSDLKNSDFTHVERLYSKLLKI